eukprot:m.341967 g.341967  ORF g.341967 m.341967 type:complete len:130 (-) comp20716_c0_seq1:52-441(-)
MLLASRASLLSLSLDIGVLGACHEYEGFFSAPLLLRFIENKEEKNDFFPILPSNAYNLVSHIMCKPRCIFLSTLDIFDKVNYTVDTGHSHYKTPDFKPCPPCIITTLYVLSSIATIKTHKITCTNTQKR